MEGYSSIIYRLSGVLPFPHGDPAEDLDVLKLALAAYYFTDSLDEPNRDLVWRHFVIPSMLMVFQTHLSSNAHRVRFNEYFYEELPSLVPQRSLQEESVIGMLATLIDAGSVPNVVMEHQTLSELVFSIFPGLEEFMARVSPEEGVFISAPICLAPLAHFMTEIQVFSFICFTVIDFIF